MNIKTLGIIIASIIGAGIGIYITSSTPEELVEENRNTTKRVTVASVSQLQSERQEEIFAYGQVVSVTGIDVVPEVNGIVTRLGKRLGSTVRPGDVVVQLQNTSETQQVAQARASLAQAQAQLAKISKDADASTQAQAQSGLVSAQSALTQTRQSTLSSLDSLYSSLENSITTQIDREFFSNVNTDFPDVKLDIEVESDEIALGQIRAKLSDSFDLDRSYDNVDAAVSQFTTRVTEARNLTQALQTEINKLEVDASLSQNTIDSQLALIASVQSQFAELNAQANTLESVLKERRQAVVSAELQVQDVKEGADREDILSAEASVAQAQAGLLSAQIAFGKTQIKAPVFGTVSVMNARVGQLVGPGSPVFSLANENALRIDTNVTSSEARKLSIGDSVLIDGEYTGSISVIAPSVNGSTGKVEIQVLLDDQDATIVSGSGVGLAFNPELNTSSLNKAVTIPIEAIFVRAGESYVYVLQDGKAVPTQIITNDLFGESIEVESGLESSDLVLLSARGVKDNQEVEVSNTK